MHPPRYPYRGVHNNISIIRHINFTQGNVLLHDSCSLSSFKGHVFMKKALKHTFMSQSAYLPMLADSHEHLTVSYAKLNSLCSRKLW